MRNMKKAEALRRDASARANHELYYYVDACYALENLGVPHVRSSKALAKSAIQPQMLGVDPKKYYFSARTLLYPKGALWTFFQEEAERYGFNPRSVGIASFDDVIRIGYNDPCYHSAIMTSRPSKKDRPHVRKDENPQFENAIKVQEQ